uniref:Transposase Tc1-like domain-containing protein n=1 Tax=Acanthochromis polyacanthus TaxID=80966 RepID=A0A3Q1ELY2_9TELE
MALVVNLRFFLAFCSTIHTGTWVSFGFLPFPFRRVCKCLHFIAALYCGNRHFKALEYDFVAFSHFVSIHVVHLFLWILVVSLLSSLVVAMTCNCLVTDYRTAESLFLIYGLVLCFKLLLEVFSVIHGPQEECVRALRNGHLLGISPGGVREALFSDETYPLLWGKRKGFAQVAIDSQVVRCFKFGSTSNQPHNHKPHVITPAQDLHIQHLPLQDCLNTRTATAAIGLHHQSISAQTVTNHLREAHLHACHPHWGLNLTAVRRRNRLEWANVHI